MALQPAQQPGQPRVRIPVPAVQPYLQTLGDATPDIRHWFLTFESYLDIVDINQDPANPLQDREKKALLISHLGNEGLRSFGTTPEYRVFRDPQQQMTYLQLKDHVIAHFRRAPSTFKARFDFTSRHQQEGESIKEYLLALRALVVDCGFENIQPAEAMDEAIKTQLVCFTTDSKARLELFSRQGPMTLEHVVAFFECQRGCLS